MQEQGIHSKVICEIKPEIEKKVHFYRKLLFFVNIPIMLFIPFALESGFILDPIHA